MNDENEIIVLHPDAGEKNQAADWLAKLDRGLTAEERSAFEAWLAEDPRNRDAIKAAAAFWYGLNAPLSQLRKYRMERGAGASSAFTAKGVYSLMATAVRRPVLVISLAALLAFGVVELGLMRAPVQSGYYSTSIGESRMISLADGSSVTLNTNSILEQDFSRKQRVIRLVSGEAVFDVAHDKSRPFLVYAADGVIRAVGTKFAVRLEPDNVRVTVTEGRVEMQRRAVNGGDGRALAVANSTIAVAAVHDENMLRAAPVLLQQGEAGEIDRVEGASKQAVSERDMAERLSWVNGQLVFYDRELQSVIAEVARYTPVTIQIEDDALRTRRITGIIQIGDVSVMLDTIEQSLGVRAEEVSPNLIYLSTG